MSQDHQRKAAALNCSSNFKVAFAKVQTQKQLQEAEICFAAYSCSHSNMNGIDHITNLISNYAKGMHVGVMCYNSVYCDDDEHGENEQGVQSLAYVTCSDDRRDDLSDN